MAASFVKALSFVSADGAVSVTSSAGHQAGDVAIVWASSRGNNADPALDAGGSTYVPANLTILSSVNCLILGSSRVKVRAFIYEIPDTSTFTLAFADSGAMNAVSGVVYRGIDVPSGYIADTHDQDNSGTSVSIPAGTVAVGSIVAGILASGADTTSTILSSFSGANLTGITIRESGHGDVSSGIGHYLMDGVASATSVGPITGTASISDYWGAASIELVPSGGGGQTITGSDHVDGDSFGSGSVSVGPVAIAGTLFTDGDTFGAGTVAPGAVTVTGALHADPDSFFAGAISTGTVTIAGGAHADPDAFGSGTVSQGGAPSQGITGSDHVDPDSFWSGAVSAGAVVIAGTLHVDGDSFGSGSVQPGSVTLTGTIFVDPDVIGSGIVSQGGPPPQNLGGLSFSDADVFGAGTIQPGAVSIGGGQFVDVDTFGAGLVSAGGIQITGLRFSDPDSFGSGSIQPGPVVLAGTLFVDPDTFGAGTVYGGALVNPVTPAERILTIFADDRVLSIPAEDRNLRVS